MGPNVVILAIMMSLKNAMTLADDPIGEAQAKSWDNRVKKALTAQCMTRTGCLTPLCSERNLEGPSDGEDFGGKFKEKRGKKLNLVISRSIPPSIYPSSASVGNKSNINMNAANLETKGEDSTTDLSMREAVTADSSLTRMRDAKRHRSTGKGCFIRTHKNIFHIDGNMKKTKLSIQGWTRKSYDPSFYVEDGNFYFFDGKSVLKIGKYSRFKVNFRPYKHISGLANTRVHNIAIDTKNALFVAETSPFLRFYNLGRRKMKTIRKLHGTQLYLDRHNRCIFYKKDSINIGKADYNGKQDKSFQCFVLATEMLFMDSRAGYVEYYLCFGKLHKYETNIATLKTKIRKTHIRCTKIRSLVKLGDKLLGFHVDGRQSLYTRGKRVSTFHLFSGHQRIKMIRNSGY